MSYFILEVHKAYTPPHLTNWHGILDDRTLKQRDRPPIHKYTTFPIRHHMQTVFTDIILHPCLMVSKKAMQAIQLYDSSIRFERLILYDPEIKKTSVYYLPKLEELDVLTANSRLNRDKSAIDYAEVNGENTKGKVLFQVTSLNGTCILIHSDLVESLLRRNAVGIGLKETNIVYPLKTRSDPI